MLCNHYGYGISTRCYEHHLDVITPPGTCLVVSKLYLLPRRAVSTPSAAWVGVSSVLNLPPRITSYVRTAVITPFGITVSPPHTHGQLINTVGSPIEGPYVAHAGIRVPYIPASLIIFAPTF